MLVRRIESAVIKRAGRSKTNNEDETTRSVRTPERGAPLQRRRVCGAKREEETEIATETKVASFGRARERGAKSWEREKSKGEGVKTGRERAR